LTWNEKPPSETPIQQIKNDESAVSIAQSFFLLETVAPHDPVIFVLFTLLVQDGKPVESKDDNNIDDDDSTE
jgi:hypothetical protein